MMNMKKLVLAATLALTALTTATDALAYSSKYRCDVVLYDGLTKAGTKQLYLCVSPGGISYNFGPVDGKPELDVLIPTSKVITYSNNRFPSIELRNGTYTYEVSDDSIMVSNKGKHLATVNMREPNVSELGMPLTQYGISDAD